MTFGAIFRPPDWQPSSGSAPTSRRRLNPLFVEWLLGWPENWTSLAPLGSDSRATASSRSRRRSRGASSVVALRGR